MTNKELFINSYLNKITQNYGIDKDKAFEVFSIAAILDKSFDEVFNNIIIKGRNDGGIDGVYYLEDNGFYQMFVFQCKNRASLIPNEINKFRGDFRDLFIDGNRVSRGNISDIKPKIDEYLELTRKGFTIDHKLYFIFNGLINDTNYRNNITAFETYNNPGDNFFVIDGAELYDRIDILIKAQGRRNKVEFSFNPISSNIVPSDNQGLISFQITNVKAITCRISATELCKLVDKEIERNQRDEKLFSENIRGFLGLRNKTNKKIKETLDSEDPFNFPFLNNGITILCESLTVPKSPQAGSYIVPVVNPVIVNGLQTTKVIYEVYKNDEKKLTDVTLLIRLYETNDTALIDKITDATNTQSAINFRDKISNKDFTTYTKALFEANCIGYISKRGETFINNFSKQVGEAVESETVIKYWYATFYEKPEISKNSISKVLEDVYDATNMESPLDKLFNGDRNSPIYKQLLIAYKIYRFVQKMKSQKVNGSEFIAHADELLSYGVYKNVEGDFISVDDSDKMKDVYNEVYSIVEKIVKDEIELHNNQNKVFSFSSFFKSPKCRVEYNKEKSILEEDDIINKLLGMT